jgi:hypothetical protein
MGLAPLGLGGATGPGSAAGLGGRGKGGAVAGPCGSVNPAVLLLVSGSGELIDARLAAVPRPRLHVLVRVIVYDNQRRHTH